MRRFVLVNDPVLGGQILRDGQEQWSTLPVQHREGARDLLAPTFEADAIRGYVDAAVPIFEEAAASWAEAGHVAFKTAARELFARVAASTLMGIDDPRKAARLHQSMRKLSARSGATSTRAWLNMPLRDTPRGYRFLFEAFRRQVEDRRASSKTDLFSRVCRVAPGDGVPGDDARVHVFLDLMCGVIDTTAAAATSMAYLLATNGTWQERLQTEAICTTLDRPTFDDLESMVRHELAWKETLRHYPIVSTVPRLARGDVELGGVHIARGTVVTVMLGTALRDPEFWPWPDAFDPGRFDPTRADHRRYAAVSVPFAAGPVASCAARLSTLHAKAFWHAFGTRARFRLANPYEATHEFGPFGVVSGHVDLFVEPLVARGADDEP